MLTRLFPAYAAAFASSGVPRARWRAWWPAAAFALVSRAPTGATAGAWALRGAEVVRRWGTTCAGGAWWSGVAILAALGWERR